MGYNVTRALVTGCAEDREGLEDHGHLVLGRGASLRGVFRARRKKTSVAGTTEGRRRDPLDTRELSSDVQDLSGRLLGSSPAGRHVGRAGSA